MYNRKLNRRKGALRDIAPIIDKYVWQFRINKVNKEYHNNYESCKETMAIYPPYSYSIRRKEDKVVLFNYRIMHYESIRVIVNNINTRYKCRLICYSKKQPIDDVPRLYYYSSGNLD